MCNGEVRYYWGVKPRPGASRLLAAPRRLDKTRFLRYHAA